MWIIMWIIAMLVFFAIGVIALVRNEMICKIRIQLINHLFDNFAGNYPQNFKSYPSYDEMLWKHLTKWTFESFLKSEHRGEK
jgi:hypothetical protein